MTELQLTHLGRDELEPGELAPCLLVDDVLHLGVDLGQRGIQDLVLRSVSEAYRRQAETYKVGGGGDGGHCAESGDEG